MTAADLLAQAQRIKEKKNFYSQFNNSRSKNQSLVFKNPQQSQNKTRENQYNFTQHNSQEKKTRDDRKLCRAKLTSEKLEQHKEKRFYFYCEEKTMSPRIVFIQ